MLLELDKFTSLPEVCLLSFKCYTEINIVWSAYDDVQSNQQGMHVLGANM